MHFSKFLNSCLIKFNHKKISLTKVYLLFLLLTVLARVDLKATTIQLWTSESKPDRIDKQKNMAKLFLNKTGHEVKITAIDEKDLDARVSNAITTHTLPDIIYHPLKYVHPWAEAGILDINFNNRLANQLSRTKFSTRALTMAKYNRMTASFPVAGWTVLVLYRSDLFKAKKLAPPNSFATITKAIRTIHSPPDIYGIVVPTKASEEFMSQILEYIFLANGVSPVNASGYQSLDTSSAREALKFYKFLAEASPPGELHSLQAREYYFSGKAAMTIWPTPILDNLDNIRGSFSADNSKKSAQRNGVVSAISGPSNPSGTSWANFYYLGVTSNANTEVAGQFVEYYVNQNHSSSPSKDPMYESPIRGKTSVTANNIVSSFKYANRWGVYQNQFILASKISESKIINKVVRRYIDGEISLNRTIRELDRKLSAIK